ncbi:hypothetical protein GTY65_20245 [Streptomyces sp. SID8379]|uniref:hypothetical protein n=1 Tax=unclassified Streptomyces TaxID=2593676 RepID=UPI00035EC278|nr:MULTISPECIES: hypothetical protein [unclassified Streptomyces]MYW66368.1 hypothetical protein [Streptomyces sp. SID8379]
MPLRPSPSTEPDQHDRSWAHDAQHDAPPDAHHTATATDSLPDPRVRAAVDHVVRELGLAADKVAAHYADPATYPFPTDRSAPEHLLAERFYDVPDDRKKRAGAAVLADLADGPGRAARLGDLAGVDLRSPASVETQAHRLSPPPELAHPGRELGGPSPVAVTTAPPLHHLDLRIHHVWCRDETDEWGADPVRLAAVCLGPDGAAHRTEPLEAGRFNDGDTVTYAPPRPLHRFTLADGHGIPEAGQHPVLALLVLSTQDPQGARDGETLADHVERLFALARRKLGTLLGQDEPGVPGAACAVVGAVFDRLRARFGDDTFRPVTLSPSPRGPRSLAEAAQTSFHGHGGHYQVTYDWHLSA